jgi:hypothetical protein
MHSFLPTLLSKWTTSEVTPVGDGKFELPLPSDSPTDKTRVFIIEGLFTLLLATISFYLIVHLPEKAAFLTSAEKALLLKRLQEDSLSNSEGDKIPLTLKDVAKTMTHWKVVLP